MPLSICSACRLPSSSVVTNLPCTECLESLLTAPEICAVCLGFTCPPAACARPWLRIAGENDALRFASVRAAYLSVGPGARVLKSWKTSPSASLTRHLFAGVRARIAAYPPTRPLVLIPVPQSDQRRWELAGGSTRRLGAMIREARRNPDDLVLDLLDLSPAEGLDGEFASRAQAKTSGGERYSRRSAIRARAEARTLVASRVNFATTPTILLVDDFLTSGSTLRSALRATRETFAGLGEFAGRFPIDVFVLGFRPALFRDER